MTLAVLHREDLKEYDFGPGHPFRGDRHLDFPPFLRRRVPARGRYRFLRARGATDADLLLICRREYIDFTRSYYRLANLGLEGGGGFSNFHSEDNRPRGTPGKVEEAARLVVGQARKACDLVWAGKYQKAVSLGGGMHHAKPGWGEGFCLYNDVAFAGQYLLTRHGLERILILDTDAHGGNGTAEYFYRDPRVLFIDLHQDPRTLYPGTGFVRQTGEGEGKGFTVNLPMPPRAGDECYRLVFEKIVLPLAREFGPQIIIRNGGSDPHHADSLTNLGLTLGGFRMIGEKVREMAGICGGREVDMIGSGYNREILPYAWLALLSGLADFPLALEDPVPPPAEGDRTIGQTEEMIAEAREVLKGRWPSLAG